MTHFIHYARHFTSYFKIFGYNFCHFPIAGFNAKWWLCDKLEHLSPYSNKTLIDLNLHHKGLLENVSCRATFSAFGEGSTCVL